MITLYRAHHVFPVGAPPLRDGGVAVEHGRILDVAPWATVRTRFPGAHVVDLEESVLLPASVNAHTHLELTGLASAIPEGLPFAEWIIALVRARRALTPEEYEHAAVAGVAAARATGTAAVGEICTFGKSVRPIVEGGLRGVIYFELLGVDPAEAPALLRRGQDQLARWQAEYGGAGVRFGLSLHTPYTVSAELFQLASRWCAEEGVPLSIHAAESPAESQWLLNSSGPIATTLYTAAGWPIIPERAPACSPIAYLDELGVFAAQPLLAHGVQVSRDDLARLARAHIPVAHCPRSNARLLVGRLPYAAYREAAIQLALGTDSLASSPSLSIWDELAAAWAAHSAAEESPSAQDFLRLATLDGAAALGMERELGSLEPGKLAEMAYAPLVALPEDAREDAARVLSALVAGELIPQRVVI